MLADYRGSGTSEREFSEELLELFTTDGFIENLAIYGDMRKVDFSNRYFRRCKFIGYDRFTSCDFSGAQFSHSIIDVPDHDQVNPTWRDHTFDATCDIGNLAGRIGELHRPRVARLKAFFEQFYVDGAFVSVPVDKIAWPHGCSASSNFFRLALQQHLLFRDDNDLVGVTRAYKNAVHSYLTNSALSRELNEVLEVMPQSA